MALSKLSTTLFLAAAALSTVHGHGQMTKPEPRPVTERYRRDCYVGLKGAGDSELQWAPVQNLLERKQNQPYAPTFDVENGCRGMIYEEGMPVTELTAGQEFTVEYYIQAPHPGYLELAIVKPKKDESGKIIYERAGVIKRIENFAQNSNDKSTTATIPSSISGCDRKGDCALQFYWHSDLAKQTYPTCADIIIKGGSSGGDAPAPTPTSSQQPRPTSAPSSSPSLAPAPSPTKKNCKRRMRRRVRN
ncbi:hypothetical protein P43SY_003162 [Pythium insidiosum]|uniref:Chitin-binding type-4 domain-containing protein n=1 Tax=Pythium insidiosum TaxID=114742 RepID=A0AAD5Q992_PYTIN|nr:hypothetical protein P43SY_003162 [Pythium insidiosum]